MRGRAPPTVASRRGAPRSIQPVRSARSAPDLVGARRRVSQDPATSESAGRSGGRVLRIVRPLGSRPRAQHHRRRRRRRRRSGAQNMETAYDAGSDDQTGAATAPRAAIAHCTPSHLRVPPPPRSALPPPLPPAAMVDVHGCLCRQRRVVLRVGDVLLVSRMHRASLPLFARRSACPRHACCAVCVRVDILLAVTSTKWRRRQIMAHGSLA